MDAWLKREGKLKMASIENMIKWFKDREGKVTYSMNSRLGPNRLQEVSYLRVQGLEIQIHFLR